MAYGPAYGVITRDAFHVHRDVDLQLRGLRGRRARRRRLSNEPDDDQDQNNDEQHVDEIAALGQTLETRTAEVTERPEQDQDNDENFEHGSPPVGILPQVLGAAAFRAHHVALTTFAIAVMVFQVRVVTGTPKSRSSVPR